MINIAICDDEQKYLIRMQELIQSIMQKQQIEEYELALFSSAKELKEKIAERQEYQVIFLDINMPQMSGLELAQEIREYDKDVILLFMTAFLDYAIEGYRLNVLRFLLKDMLEQLLPECMDAVFRKLQLHTETITCPFIEGEKTIPIADICYIESQKHMSCVQGLLKNHAYEEANDYLRNMNENWIDEVDYINTNHVIANSVLNQKYKQARKKGIAMILSVNDLQGIPLKDEDMVTLLANLLDNAIEACEKISRQAKMIRARGIFINLNDQREINYIYE